MKQTSLSVDSLWEKWQKKKDQEAGNLLVEHYMPIVDYQVNRMFAHLPKNVDKQDVKSLAFMGLVDALEKFDTSRDLKFDTYASFRIRGAIIDGLRKEDWLPRSVRDKSKLIEQTYEELEQALYRTPTIEEVAKQVNMSKDEVAHILKDTLFANLLSIEDKTTESDDEQRENLRNTIPDQEGHSPHETLEKKENIEELTEKITELNEKEQLVISLFYKEELTFTEIGEVLSLSTSRISQIHSQSIVKLRKQLSIN
ncbi:FliA/WhiG family RNA polymerase sigma factor [Tenuibacillus multivorans]|uniref:RNA polymerase sigma factor for flagellar operon FliA n=1 Tax=Tenuibacillus multivorans TaxID=237069 RepID=A0A1G9XXS3_9BACI|nr:FliA/WhiG family RNA polymerase sigma factor [Tenuibacillus multivorans]GEL75853.1 RNA polymerase sigma-D factor [Tenuibacillus multivorans]SDN01341.1 RNA polymerase sigma factor for flagellar operon FliA [Tenuibacillus multivorans]